MIQGKLIVYFIHQQKYSQIISLNFFTIDEYLSELHEIDIDQHGSLKQLGAIYRKKIQSSTGEKARIKFIQIGDQCYGCEEEKNLRQLNVENQQKIIIHYFINTSTKEEIIILGQTQPELIALKVYLHYGYLDDCWQEECDSNTSLKSLIAICKQNERWQGNILKWFNENNYRIRYITIKDQYYHETDEKGLKELGVYNKTKIQVSIEKQLSFKQSLKNLQFGKELHPILYAKEEKEKEEKEKFIMNYQNYVFQHQDENGQKRMVQLEQEILIQNFQNPGLNKEHRQDQIFQQKKQNVMNTALRRNLEKKRQNGCIIVPFQGYNQLNNDQDLLIFLLAEQFQYQGQKVYQTKQNDELNLLSLQASFGYGLEDTTCLQLTIKSNEKITFHELKDKQKLQLFQEQLRLELAQQYKVLSQDIHLLQIDEGSIKIQFKINGVSKQQEWKKIDEILKIYPNSELVLQKYFQEIVLSAEDFDPKHNYEWNIFDPQFQSRGPISKEIKYFLPLGWKGYALKVLGKYDNDDWLKMDGNPNQWHIMYHGTNHLWAGEEGVYLSNHVEVAENRASHPIRIGDFQYKILFQSRVRPQSLKQIKKQSDIESQRGNSDWDNDYFVVNRPEDIRPYRILVKKEKYQTKNQNQCHML